MRLSLCLLISIPLLATANSIESVATPAGPGSLAPGLSITKAGPVLTWLEPVGDGHELRLSIYRDGMFEPAGTIATGGDWFVNWADTPALFELPGGGWLAHWLEKSADGTYTYDIRMKSSRDRGRTWSEPFTLHADGTESEHGFVSYYVADKDAAGLFWLDGRQTVTDGAMALRTAVVGADGRIEGREGLDDRVCDCCQTGAAVTDAGPVVVYRNRSEDEIRDIYLRRFADGRWQPPVAVHDDGWKIAACPVNGPSIVADGMQVTVAWFTMAGDRPRVMLTTSSDGGASFNSPVEVAAGTAQQGRVELIRGVDSGELLLTWLGHRQLWLARFDRNLNELARRSLVTVDGSRISGFPRLAPLDEDHLLVAWTVSVEGTPRIRVGRVAYTGANGAPLKKR